MGWKSNLSIIALICVAIFLLINRYLTGWIAIPGWSLSLTPGDSAIPEQAYQSNDEETELDIKESAFESNQSLHHGHRFAKVTGNCKTPKNASGKIIYRWLDENGVVHLSNRGRPTNANVIVAGTISPDSITIDLYGDTPPDGFRKSLRKRIDDAIKIFAKVTDEAVVVPVHIKMRLFTQKSDYIAFQKQVAPKLNQSAGFYRSGSNESAVYLHPQFGLDTAVHEAMHAINRAWFGRIARWLNEGMAEVAEGKSSFASISTLPLQTLLSSKDEDWQSSKRSSLYQSSKAFVQYLNDNHQQVLARLLQRESENGCDVLTMDDVFELSDNMLSRISVI